MSLEAIRSLRQQGQKPSRAIFVVIGDREEVPGDYQTVTVRQTDDPSRMDWRPMVGLSAAIFTLQPLPHLTIAVLDALLALNVNLFGAADQEGVYPLRADADEHHERLLRRGWELLCR